MKTKNECLDFVKCIACILVVFIHVRFPSLVGEVFSTLGSFAVPLFAMIAGYYAYNCDVAVIKRRTKKIAIILLYSYILYTLYELAHTISSGVLMSWLSKTYSLFGIVKLVVFCFISYASHLWYLIAMLEAYLLWIFVVKNKHESIWVKFMPLLFLAFIAVDAIGGVTGLSWYYKVNFLSRIMPWFLFGYSCHIEDSFVGTIKKMNTSVIATGLIVGCIIAQFPNFVDLKVDFSSVGVILYATSIFLLAIKHQNYCPSKTLAFIGAHLSLNIYILHILVNNVWHKVENRASFISDSTIYQWLHPLVIVLVAGVLSFVIYYFSSLFKKHSLNKLVMVKRIIKGGLV